MYSGVWQGRKQLRGPSKWRAAGFLPRLLICMGGTILCWSRKILAQLQLHERCIPAQLLAVVLLTCCPALPWFMRHLLRNMRRLGSSSSSRSGRKRCYRKRWVLYSSVCSSCNSVHPPPRYIRSLCIPDVCPSSQQVTPHRFAVVKRGTALRKMSECLSLWCSGESPPLIWSPQHLKSDT